MKSVPVLSYNEHRFLTTKPKLESQNGCDRYGHTRFISFFAGKQLPKRTFLAEGAPFGEAFFMPLAFPEGEALYTVTVSAAAKR